MDVMPGLWVCVTQQIRFNTDNRTVSHVKGFYVPSRLSLTILEHQLEKGSAANERSGEISQRVQKDIVEGASNQEHEQPFDNEEGVLQHDRIA
jgi:hypothetical protein